MASGRSVSTNPLSTWGRWVKQSYGHRQKGLPLAFSPTKGRLWEVGTWWRGWVLFSRMQFTQHPPLRHHQQRVQLDPQDGASLPDGLVGICCPSTPNQRRWHWQPPTGRTSSAWCYIHWRTEAPSGNIATSDPSCTQLQCSWPSSVCCPGVLQGICSPGPLPQCRWLVSYNLTKESTTPLYSSSFPSLTQPTIAQSSENFCRWLDSEWNWINSMLISEGISALDWTNWSEKSRNAFRITFSSSVTGMVMCRDHRSQILTARYRYIQPVISLILPVQYDFSWLHRRIHKYQAQYRGLDAELWQNAFFQNCWSVQLVEVNLWLWAGLSTNSWL